LRTPLVNEGFFIESIHDGNRLNRCSFREFVSHSAAFFCHSGGIRFSFASSSTLSSRARGLNLFVAAIILWNTVDLERAVAALREHGVAIDDDPSFDADA
jgi:TnpA family transposase